MLRNGPKAYEGDIDVTAVNERRLSLARRHQAPKDAMPLWQRRYSHSLAFFDVVSILTAVVFAQWLRFGQSPGLNATYTGVSIIIATCWIASLSINHSRSPRVIGSGAEEYRRVWLGTISVFGAVAIVSMLFKLEIARGYLVIALPTGLFLILLFRWLARRLIIRERVKHGHFVTRLLVVGCQSAVRDLAISLSREPWSGYDLVGACIPGSSSRTSLAVPGVGEIPTFGGVGSIVGAVTATRSHAVAVAATEQLHGHDIKDLSWELEKLNVDLLVSPGVVDVAGPRLHMRPVAGLPLIHVEKPQYHGAKRFEKRLFDVGFSAIVLLCGLPLLTMIALAIKLTSQGSVFYRHERIGRDGEPFQMIKFRTMVNGADSMLDSLRDLNEVSGGVLFKMKNDPRVTPIGRFLRKYSLDELPQFINVIKGEMSVVGPRPPLASEVKSYDDQARRRLLVRPGITGLWQVSGRSDLSWEDSVRLDLYYVENWSMMADMMIAVKTAKAILRPSGAY